MKVMFRFGLVAWLAFACGPSACSRLDVSVDKGFVLVPLPESALHGHRAGPRIRNRNGSSSNWAGYAVASRLESPLSGSVSDVQGTWTVPSVSATDSDHTYSSAWVGIDGYSDRTVEQTGTEHDMTPDGPVYFAWFEMYPKFGYRILNFPVEPGDRISAEVEYIGNNQFRLTIVNLTRDITFSITQHEKARRQSAEWIAEAPFSGGTLPLADFETLTFTGCSATVSGHSGSIGDPAWQHDGITMTLEDGTVKAATSNLSGGGSGFAVTWKHE